MTLTTRRIPTLASGVIAGLAMVFGVAACNDGTDLGQASPELRGALRETAAELPEARKRKIVLLGFDSCDPYLVDDMIRQGQLPNFARLRREGAAGKLRSIPPYLSPVVWTTISTGMRPDRHGILDFMTKQGGQAVPISSDQRQADTVWELLSRSGEEVGVVGWLVSYPAEPLPKGFLVTERMGRLAFEYGADRVERDEHRLTHPTALRAELAKDLVTVDDIPIGQIRPFARVDGPEYGAARAEEFSAQNPLGNLRLTMATAESFRNIGLRLHREKDPRFFACYFEAMDVLSHLFMRFAPPRIGNVDEDVYLKYRTAIQANYQWHDRVLGEFMDQCDEDTTLILVSDHGFKSGKFRLDDPSEFHARTGAMWHREYGAIFAWGNGVKAGHKVTGAGVLDIAPTILASMGYPVPDDMPGRVLSELFEDGLERRRVPTYFGDSRRKRIAAQYSALNGASLGKMSAEAQERYEQLKALGYVAGDRSDSSTGLLNLGQIRMAQGRYRQALEQFEAVLGEQLELRKKLDDKGRPLGGPTPRIYFALAEAHLALGNLADCQKNVTEAVTLAQRFASAVQRAKANGEARPDLKETPEEIRAQVRPQQLSIGVKLAMKRQNSQLALDLARELRQLKPRNPSAHVLYATVMQAISGEQRKAGDEAAANRSLDGAIAAMEAALELEPDQFYTLKEVARLRLESQHYRPSPPSETLLLLQQAQKELESALELFPTSPDGQNNYTIVLLRLGIFMREQERLEESKEWLEKAGAVVDKLLGKRATYAKAWANRAYIKWQQGEIKAAFEAAVRARESEAGYVINEKLLTVFAKRGMRLPAAAPAQPE